jgi:hypothetical protein
MNSGALGVRRQSQPPILVTRDAEYLTEYGSFKKATFRAFDSIGPARLVYQEQVKRSDILYIGRDQCAAWLRAIEEPPNEYVRAWLGDTWQEEAPKVGAGRTASDWKETARTIGEQWMLKQEKETGERPTIKEIAAHVADELSTRDIRGPRGKYPDAETIKREALKGITGRKKGDNLRR